MDKKRKILFKYAVLMLILVSALLLSACRTRITNNSEVSNVYYDEEGFISDSYQMRRDELGLSTAKKPILPDFGTAGDGEEDFDTGETINYEPEEEEYVEPPEAKTANSTTTNSTTNNSNTTTPSSSPSSQPNTPTRYTVTFFGNGGEPKEQNIQFISGSYLRFPSTAPTRKGYTFEGWYTSVDGGSKVDTKVKVEANRKLYAHWKKEKKKEEPKEDPVQVEKYTVVFYDADGNAIASQEVEKGKAATPPNPPNKPGYDFAGWSPNPENITAKTEIKPTWKFNPDKYWISVKPIIDNEDDKIRCYVDGDDAIVIECNGNSVGKDAPQKAVGYVDVETEAEAMRTKIKTETGIVDDMNIIIVSRPPKEKYKEDRLIYKLSLYKELYEVDLGISKAIEELGMKTEDVEEIFKRYQ